MDYSIVSGGGATASVTSNIGGIFTGNLVGPVGDGSVSMNSAARFANATSLTMVFTGISGSQFRLNNLTATPEPTTMLLFGSVAGVGYIVRRRKKKLAA